MMARAGSRRLDRFTNGVGGVPARVRGRLERHAHPSELVGCAFTVQERTAAKRRDGPGLVPKAELERRQEQAGRDHQVQGLAKREVMDFLFALRHRHGCKRTYNGAALLAARRSVADLSREFTRVEPAAKAR